VPSAIRKAFANAFPVGLGHESGQGAEAADTDHDQVALDALGDRATFLRPSAAPFSFPHSRSIRERLREQKISLEGLSIKINDPDAGISRI
jgi:hypothetical protein